MNYFNAESFVKAAGKLPTAFIHPIELGLEVGVFIRGLTATEREMIMREGGTVRLLEGGGQEIDMSSMKKGVMAKMANFALIVPVNGIEFDDDGYPSSDDIGEYKQMFTGSNAGSLHRMSGEVLDVISKKAREISGMSKKAVEEKKDN
jgi:hypothetical protein